MEEGSDTSFSLFCQENESSFNEHQENDDPITESDAKYIHMLIQRETLLASDISLCPIDCSINSRKCARLDVINWIFHTRALFGFHFRTAYLSLTYFDRFLSRRFIDDGKLWAIRLLSVACLSLAAKMEECKVPALSEYCVDDYAFESNAIQRMELFVLNTLEWKMGSITPFSYIHYFITKFCGDSRPKELVSKAIELILLITKEINLMDHRPSVIAAAAALAACDNQLTVKSMESMISSFESLEKDQVFTFYNLLQELEMGKSSTPKAMVSPDFKIHQS
ncbi:hypothetical protein LguiA_006034 [Lonicera macranthoides]